MTLDNILEEIKKAQTIVILTHESPDGDAVASSLSVMHAIKELGKEADVIIPEYSKDFKFLPGSEKILQIGKTDNYDLAISVDCTDLKRMAAGKEFFATAKRTIEIDDVYFMKIGEHFEVSNGCISKHRTSIVKMPFTIKEEQIPNRPDKEVYIKEIEAFKVKK